MQFEQVNDIKIYVFEYTGNYNFDYDRNKVVICYSTNNRNEKVINLLLLREDNKEHLIWIKDISKL